MSQEQPIDNGTLVERPAVRVRFDRIKRSPALTMLGLPELIGLAAAVVLAIFTLFAYFYFTVPAQAHLKSLQDERQLLQVQVRTLEKSVGEDIGTQNSVERIQKSLEDFENNRLAVSGSGRMVLYSDLNDLIHSNGLRNTAGPSYATLAPAGTKQVASSASQQSSAKWQTIYPGIAVTVTVEGPYQNVRHFVRDLETSREFLIINAVELEGVTQNGAAQDLTTTTPAAPARSAGSGVAPPSGTRGTLVSLRLDLATYFQRAAAAPPANGN